MQQRLSQTIVPAKIRQLRANYSPAPPAKDGSPPVIAADGRHAESSHAQPALRPKATPVTERCWLWYRVDRSGVLYPFEIA